MVHLILPILFVLLWSSAFVAGKAGVQYATPLAFLAVRFLIVTIIFILIATGSRIWRNKGLRPENADIYKINSSDPILQTALVGVLIHGAYLGSTFYAMANGLGATLAALIMSIQPLLTTVLAFFFSMKIQISFNGLVSLLASQAWL